MSTWDGPQASDQASLAGPLSEALPEMTEMSARNGTLETVEVPEGSGQALDEVAESGEEVQQSTGGNQKSLDDLVPAIEDTLGRQVEELAGLRAQVERFHDRSRAQEDVIDRMQARIEELQADQVRALLGPMATELATLHGELSEMAARGPGELTPERMTKELGLLVQRVESSLELLGMETVGAAPGVPFDRRWHSATRRVPTADRSQDQTIASVIRQGFGVEGAPRATVMARVTIYQHDPELDSEASRDQPRPGQASRPPLAAEGQGPAEPAVPTDEEGPPPSPPVVPMPPIPPGYHES